MKTKSVVRRKRKAHKVQSPWWYYPRIWVERYRKFIDIGLGIVIVITLLSVVMQLAYPADRTLPYMRIGGLDVSVKDRGAVLTQLHDYAERGKVTIKTPSRQWQASWQEIGLSIDREASAQTVLEYSVWERLVPFSSVMHVQQSQDMPLIAITNEERLRAFAEKIVAEDKLAAKDATIRIKDGELILDEAKRGYRYEVTDVQRQVQALPMTVNSTLDLVAKPVPFVRSNNELQAVAAEARRMLERPLKLVVANKTYQPDRKKIGQWILFTEDEVSNKKITVTINKEALKTYLEELDRASKIEPGTSVVTLLDGQEVARTPAPSGKTVAVDTAIQAIEQQLRDTQPPLELTLQQVEVPPKLQYVRTYSQASSGLQALIRDWEASNYGNYGIIVREITGTNRYAEWQPDKQFVTASTFKMFLAYTIFMKIQEGELSGSHMTDMGWTVDACMREMIVNSTNPCAISLQNLIGQETVDTMLQQAGFTSTRLNNQYGGDKYSTVRDETNFLLRLNAGTLLDKGHTEYLLGLLKRQVWRGGIPSGVPRGTTVANKVGFYDGWVHDVAIVYGPKSTYILGIMSRGGSDPKFADLSRRVYNFFNQ